MKKKPEYFTGQKIEISIHEPQKGKFPIGRAESGIICRLQQHQPKAYYEYGSVWTATINEVREKSLVVTPFELIRSREQEAKKIVSMIPKTEHKKFEKVKPKYEYKRNHERDRA